ncbi:MAG: hypothetical protein ACTSRK_13725 [Promethearchaeota archaeon]
MTSHRKNQKIPNYPKPSNKRKNAARYICCLSLCMVFAGSVAITYSYWMHPTLVPRYGGGERFYLDDYNNYTEQLPFSANSRLSIAMNANDTVQISIDNEDVYTGTFYEIEIDANVEIFMVLKSNSPVNGFFTLRQETPLYMGIFSIGFLSVGAISIFANWFFFNKYNISTKIPKMV